MEKEICDKCGMIVGAINDQGFCVNCAAICPECTANLLREDHWPDCLKAAIDKEEKRGEDIFEMNRDN